MEHVSNPTSEEVVGARKDNRVSVVSQIRTCTYQYVSWWCCLYATLESQTLRGEFTSTENPRHCKAAIGVQPPRSGRIQAIEA